MFNEHLAMTKKIKSRKVENPLGQTDSYICSSWNCKALIYPLFGKGKNEGQVPEKFSIFW